MVGKIKVNMCIKCSNEEKSSYSRTCQCGGKYELVERDKKRVSGDFKVVDWFSTRASAGLIVEDESKGLRKMVYMSDVFKYFKGVALGELTFEEVKKGTAYGWKVVE